MGIAHGHLQTGHHLGPRQTKVGVDAGDDIIQLGQYLIVMSNAIVGDIGLAAFESWLKFFPVLLQFFIQGVYFQVPLQELCFVQAMFDAQEFGVVGNADIFIPQFHGRLGNYFMELAPPHFSRNGRAGRL